MEKLTKAFVIAASSVVIAVGGVWLYQKYSEYQRLENCIKVSSDELTEYSKTDPWPWWDNATPSERREHWFPPCLKNPYRFRP